MDDLPTTANTSVPSLLPDDAVVRDFFQSMRARVLIDTTLGEMDSMISGVTDIQLDSSILKAIDYINLIKPITNYPVRQAVDMANAMASYKHLVLIGSCYQILRLKWIEWGHSGDQIQLSILSEPDRMDRFSSLMDNFKAEVDELTPGFKTSGNTRLSKSIYSSTSKSISYGKNIAMTRRGFKSAFRGS